MCCFLLLAARALLALCVSLHRSSDETKTFPVATSSFTFLKATLPADLTLVRVSVPPAAIDINSEDLVQFFLFK